MEKSETLPYPDPDSADLESSGNKGKDQNQRGSASAPEDLSSRFLKPRGGAVVPSSTGRGSHITYSVVDSLIDGVTLDDAGEQYIPNTGETGTIGGEHRFEKKTGIWCARESLFF